MNVNTSIIKNLRQNFGDAFYLLDSLQFRKNFTELKNSFAAIYPNINIGYSYKTNYTPKLCDIVNKMDGYAEVVSEMELTNKESISRKELSTCWRNYKHRLHRGDRIYTQYCTEAS